MFKKKFREIDSFDFTSFFGLGFLKIFWPAVCSINGIIQEKFRENNNSNLQNVITDGPASSVLHLHRRRRRASGLI